MVSLQSFVHFDVISMVHKSTDHGKLLSICFFYNNIDRFSHPFPLKFLGKSRAQVREKQITPPSRHIVTSFPWSVLLSREKSLNYCTKYIYIYIYIYFPAELRQSVLPFTVQVIKSATLKGLFHRAILTSNAARSPDSTAPSM